MIEKILKNYEYECTNNLVDKSLLGQAEKMLKVSFGEQLTTYLLQYGYLGYRFAELYGMNSIQKLDSDMVKQTLYLHESFPETDKYIAIENQGEGDYYLVDCSDNVYEFDTDLGEILNTGMKLYDYIENRFKSVSEQ